MRVSFTGHRPEKLNLYDENDPLCIGLKNKLAAEIEELITNGADEFFTGMARGTDIWSAEAVLMLKEKYPYIKLYAVIPCPEQTEKWNNADKARYKYILGVCDKVYTACPSYSKGCMMTRNKMLVEFADVIIAVFNGSRGGTKQTIEYARKKHKQVIELSL